jgi:hypothetical protein
MKNFLSLGLVLSMISTSFSQVRWDGNESPNYAELTAICKSYAKKHKEISLYNMGSSDAQLPIYLLVVHPGLDSTTIFKTSRSGQSILVNNAIHPGEPDGVNAMILWLDQWIAEGKPLKGMPVIGFITAYNVGGMLNRSGTSRANQEGPTEYGFRGNSQNLDLNRDFIKMDAENTKTFARIFHALDPDVFIDNHVSNGADYQYTLTLISSLKERMDKDLGEFMYKSMLPELERSLNNRKWEMFPYMNTVSSIPDSGISTFNDNARYAMGYAALFDCFSFTVETHMLKPFPQRVKATQAFFEEMLSFCVANRAEMEKLRTQAKKNTVNLKSFAFDYELNKNKHDSLLYKGFTAKYKKSEVTDLDRLYYDRAEPIEIKIPFYNVYKAKKSIDVPEFYIVKKQARNVIENLKAHGVDLTLVKKDTSLRVAGQRIVDYKTLPRPYENHFVFSEVRANFEKHLLNVEKGDYLVYSNQEKGKFIHSVLNAEAEDSYFRWNFMNSYLDQKEYFSPYVFEDMAVDILKKNPELALELSRKREENPEFAKSQWQQLFFIYKNSPYYEQGVGLLPIYLKGND